MAEATKSNSSPTTACSKTLTGTTFGSGTKSSAAVSPEYKVPPQKRSVLNKCFIGLSICIGLVGITLLVIGIFQLM